LFLSVSLHQGVVPSLGDTCIQHLKSADGFGLDNWSEFYGHWFLCNRNEASFVEYLTTKAKKSEHNLRSNEAKHAAKAIADRFAMYDFLAQKDSVRTHTPRAWRMMRCAAEVSLRRTAERRTRV
jgi:hypothetical protein